jgi:pimeloyl-ACP methyl ester carboxylesterase
MAGHVPDVERAGVTHQDCVNSLMQYIEARNLHDVILVGHSWGGNMLCGAAPHLASRLKRLIFWNAFVLEDGHCLLDEIPPDYVGLFKHLSSQTKDNTVFLPWEVWRGAFQQDGPEEVARLVYSLLSPEPMGVFEGKWDQKAFYQLKTPTSYVNCRQDIALPPGDYAWTPRFPHRLSHPKIVELDGSHEAIFTRPTELADAFIQASA